MNSAGKAVQYSPDLYQAFRSLFEHSGKLTEAEVEHLYSEDVVFCDPVHRLQGRQALQRYFADIARNVRFCHFEFVDELRCDNAAHITWNMHFSHPRLAGGRRQTIRGMSLVRFAENGIYYHEDCYDLGAMLYEHMPVLGMATRFLKKRLGGER